ncbi:xanthine dehydrogenase family protein subunit M [Planosporangium flavigriseum]|uniref:Carbon-monoxide dehydrogenase medium subunit n=1 Tax=Planosporangium flavigriseum TaxID=373681 RepID=A0A8J3PJ05_9ACTN|nr:xanthine dehydrogenase family protein subunit M [Planosporangium flavigriseum]NJC65172.1 xanthine dehydrogenase family protein subunit M [Planosporangium flavigriseum]GIG71791.1 carbon-monoxide dehydrogenase medium subunit [Planosporangium flavigriseum]
MIPAAVDYSCPSTVEEAVQALGDEDAKVLAGGQSLIPMLRLRLAAPTLLVDLDRISDLRGVRSDGDHLVIGAMTTHAAVLGDPLVNQYAPLLAQATATVADRQVRHRGTLGGSLAHADPAGDLPAVVVALDASMEVAGPGGRREIAAADFFVDYFTPALEPGEVLVSVRVPKREGWSTHYEKFNRMAQGWALVGVAAAVRRDNGTIAEARIALTNMGSTPVRATAVESALTGADASLEAVRAAAAAAAEGTQPSGDLSASAEYRSHLARVLTERAIMAAVGQAHAA